jgi:tetratricopeptide (TPR) repeat protein
LRRIAAMLLLWAVGTGALYEWGGSAARGVRELKKGKHREAIESLRKGRTELPRSAAVRYDEGIAFRGLGLTDSALAAFRDATGSPGLEGDPARSAAAFNLGNEAMSAKDYAEAARQYRQSLRVDPTRIDAKKNLEEAIRRSRNEKSKPQGGGGGSGQPSQGNENQGPATGTGQQGAPSPLPQPGGEPERIDKSRMPQLGDAIPNRAEAEHWLDALESDRRAARLRDRRDSEKAEEGQRDW